MQLLKTTLLYAVTIAAVAAQSAIAQDKPARSGFGFSLGLGQGSTGVTCEGCEQYRIDRMEGLTGYLRIGGYASPKFFVGAEGTGWMKNSDGVNRRIAAVSVVFLGYPSARAGFFVRTGVGMLRAVIEDPSVTLVGEGFTWQVGVGYDIALGAVALTPFVTYLNSSQVALDVNEISSGFNLNPNILQVGLAITIP